MRSASSDDSRPLDRLGWSLFYNKQLLVYLLKEVLSIKISPSLRAVANESYLKVFASMVCLFIKLEQAVGLKLNIETGKKFNSHHKSLTFVC